MKKIFIFLFVISISFLYSQTNIPAGNASVTSGIFSGLKVGLGRASISDDSSSEITLNYKADSEATFNPKFNGKIDIHNIYLQWNRFYNSNRTKSFFLLKGGVFWFKMVDWFGGTDREHTLALPMLSIGYGYSYRLNEKSFLRPSIDLGFQGNIINVEITYFFNM